MAAIFHGIHGKKNVGCGDGSSPIKWYRQLGSRQSHMENGDFSDRELVRLAMLGPLSREEIYS